LIFCYTVNIHNILLWLNAGMCLHRWSMASWSWKNAVFHSIPCASIRRWSYPSSPALRVLRTRCWIMPQNL